MEEAKKGVSNKSKGSRIQERAYTKPGNQDEEGKEILSKMRTGLLGRARIYERTSCGSKSGPGSALEIRRVVSHYITAWALSTKTLKNREQGRPEGVGKER